MEEEGLDPFAVNRNPQIIKAAQEQIATMDVLVCGVCHSVFHFIEEFQEHKAQNACGTPAFKGNITETKPQVWAFLLWKSSRAKSEIGEGADQVSSWKLYQKWCQIPENIRESWVSAGKAIQVSTTLASAKMQEVKTVGKLRMMNKPKSGEAKDPSDNEVKKEGVVRKMTNIRGKPGRPALGPDDKPKEGSDEDKKDGSVENGADLLSDSVDIKEEQVSEADVEEHAAFEEDDHADDEARRARLEGGEDADANKQTGPQKVEIKKSHTEVGDGSNVVRRKGKDGEKGSDSEDEYVVERIVSRRYNIRKRAFEYLLKWEGYPDDQNTWEPAENLADCKHLLENFEKNLAKQKAQQQARGPSGLPSGPKMITATPEQRRDLLSPRSVGRPVRSSKKKAMDQVKAWCGSMYTKKEDDRQGSSDGSEDEDGVRKIKSLSESEDANADGNLSSDEFGRKRKLKEEDEIYKKGPGRPRKIIKVNGMPSAPGEFITGFDGGSGDKKSPIVLGKKEPGGNITLSTAQQPVLVANSKGVVKVDARSMPNLASGVYIMSKSGSGGQSSGLIKVDSPATASPSTPNIKVVTGPGQKQGGILAMKDAKSGVTVISPSATSPTMGASPPKTILGPKKPTVLGAAPSPVTPMKLLPKLVSPQIRGGGLVRVNQTTRPTLGSPAAPRPLGPGRMPLTPRPSLVSPQTPTSAGKGIRPLKPKQSFGAVGKAGAIPLSTGMKSGIRPIEAMLGATSANQTTPTTTRTILGKRGTPVINVVSKDSTADAKKTEGAASTPGRGAAAMRGRAKGGRVNVGESKEDKTKLTVDGAQVEFTEVEMSPGGTTGTVVSEGGTQLLRTEAGLTATAGQIVSAAQLAQLGGQVQGISLPARKLYTEDGTEIVESDGDMVTIQGEDGVVYQVQGELEDGTQTLLVQGEDGEQRCVYVTTNEGVEGEDGTVVTFSDPAFAGAVQLDPSQVTALSEGGSQILLQGEDGTTFSETQLMSVMEGDKDDGGAQIVAQVLQAEQPQPGGGPRKVVLLLPDGNMMMTEVDEEQYAALELDK